LECREEVLPVRYTTTCQKMSQWFTWRLYHGLSKSISIHWRYRMRKIL
jgi:hypothetical protein